MDESISSFRGVWCTFYMFDADQTPRSAAYNMGLHCLPDLGQHCLPVSLKKEPLG